MHIKSSSYRLLCLLAGSLWHRHMAWHFLKASALSLFALFIFYVCLDASMNSHEIRQFSGAIAFIHHYLLHFFKRLPQLLPFALTLASTHILLRMQRLHETISLVMGGSSRLSILSPFLRVCGMSSLIILACTEGWFFAPAEMKTVQINPMGWLTSTWVSRSSDPLEAIPLDHELECWLIFHHFDSDSKTFYNVFWIESDSSWWHFDHLKLLLPSDKQISSSYVVGYEADHFKKQPSNQRHWSAHYPSIELKIAVNLQQLSQEARGPQELPALDLWKALEGDFPKIQRPKLRSYLYYRLMQPLLCFFAPLPAAIITLRYSRQISVFAIYFFAIMALVTLFMVQQSGLLLASAGRMHPLWAIVCPTAVSFLIAMGLMKQR